MVTEVTRYQTENGKEFDIEAEALREEARYELGSLFSSEIQKRGNTADIIAAIVISRFPEISDLVNKWHDANAAIDILDAE